MSAMPPRPVPPEAPDAPSGEYLVSYGKSGAFGRFAGSSGVSLPRGARVVVETPRGVELGAVLCPASTAHARLLTAGPTGRLLRPADDIDHASSSDAQLAAERLVQACAGLARDLALPLEVLDAEVLLGGRRAVVQYLGAPETDISPLADALARDDWFILFENLAVPVATLDEPAAAGGCGKPDCGKTSGGSGGCSSCGAGGGCSSCGAGKVDLRPYFAHLRGQMEARGRVSLA